MAKTTIFPLLFLVFFSLLAASFSSISATCTFPASLSPSPPPHNVKGMFIFGSSYVDNGNNNFINTLAKVNYAPYGIDFPFGPSGRFTNGKNVIDLLAEELELPPYIPVFYNPETVGKKIINGVNFASGGSGILDDTGSLVGVISLNQQIKNFEEVTLKELEQQVGCQNSELLRNYLFVLGAGGNDYSLNYFRNNSNNVTLRDFTADLIASLARQIQKLYDLGARKFVLMSLYPIGCNPLSIASNPGTRDCVNIYNMAAHIFNRRLRSLVDTMIIHMPGSNPVYVNAYSVIRSVVHRPALKGFRDARTTCCEAVLPQGGGLCTIGGSTCANRNTHVFFDGVHPTEAVNKLIATSAFSSNLPTQVYPINIKRLAEV